MNSLPERLPVLPLRDLVFFPSMVLPLLVGRPRSVSALEEAESSPDGLLLVLAQRDPDTEDPGSAELHRVGTVVRLLQVTPLADGTTRVVFEGLERAVVDRFQGGAACLRARAHTLPYPDNGAELDTEGMAHARRIERSAREYVHLHPDLPGDLADGLGKAEMPTRLVHRVAGHLLIGTDEKQTLLERESTADSMRALQEILERELEILRIERTLDEEVRSRAAGARDEDQMRQQFQALQREMEGMDEEWAELEERIREAELPPAARERADRELTRLTRLGPASPEAGVIRNYLDWILALPWMDRSADLADVAAARDLLEKAHYGLDEVKDRILDHIAVLSMVGKIQGPILCLVGPPGVGKTSLGQSIAEALGRRFVRISLGGVRDEAEIRGHRRAYVGSLPGRILQGVRRAGTGNPVFLLDEVDKITRDAHGDPASALLEVLDPEQNRTFQDHYLELDFDLSEVLFVATANTLQGIPDALRDRMEVIRIPGYLDTEKRVIARSFLVPNQLRRHGFDPEHVRLDDDAAGWLIENYTREAGVRELDRCLARVARKLARQVAEGERERETPALLLQADVRRLLGPPPMVRPERDGGSGRVGIATGLAWTSVGGELLEVEVAVVPGAGSIQLTGTLGDVMKESAVAAITFARSRARMLGLQPQFHREIDVHIHIPEGATPKDGPSAGVTIALALISALTGRPTLREVAMTGEITLRGRILPVGGMKEKSVAALRGGLTSILIPAGNESEIRELPDEVRERLEIRVVREIDEVLELGLEGGAGWLGRSGSLDLQGTDDVVGHGIHRSQ